MTLTATAILVAVTMTACAQLAPPAEIPIGGVREPITREELAVARAMPGGLLEPTWLPEGFELVHVSFDGPGEAMQSADLVYQSERNYLHIWQTNITPDELGEEDPLPRGEPLEGTSWNANPLSAAQVGTEGVVEYTTRLPDGRTVSVDSNLESDVMIRVLESLRLHSVTTED